jgi:CheY-like chemotaxis protein
MLLTTLLLDDEKRAIALLKKLLEETGVLRYPVGV